MAATARAAASPPDTVVLLHGLGLGGWAMTRVEAVLRRDGYRVVNLSYPSRTVPLETLARDWLPSQLRAHGADTAPRLHFVTHSMGGILLRLYVGDTPPPNLVRTVMLAPPNRGSEVAEHLKNFLPFQWMTGVNGHRLGTGPASVPLALGPWPAAAGELAIISGDRSLNPLFSAWLGGPGDGKVSVASTQLAGQRAHLVLRHSHTWLAWSADTAREVRAFLKAGEFSTIAPL